MNKIVISHYHKRKPNVITKADKDAHKSDDLIKKDFSAEKSLEKCVTDITKIKEKDGKLYVSAIFDCFDSAGGRCHDNAKCESMWARMKEELFYGRYKTKMMTIKQLKQLI